MREKAKKTGWKEDGVYLCERVCVCVSMCSTHKSTRGVTMVLPFCNRRLWSQCAAATNTREVHRHRAYTRRLVSVHTTDWSRRPKRANRPLPRVCTKIHCAYRCCCFSVRAVYLTSRVFLETTVARVSIRRRRHRTAKVFGNLLVCDVCMLHAQNMPQKLGPDRLVEF